METLIKEAAEIIVGSDMTLALTGAGISVESGIPDFRSEGGLWSKYDPAVYANISAFQEDPEMIWEMLKDMGELVENAEPNPAHRGMGELESMGCLHHIITQNVDSLHQAGGSKNIIEYHGHSRTLSCLWCGKKYSAEEKKEEHPPRCECERILKPDVIFFGEAIPSGALNKSFQLASIAKALMIVGTSAVVSPANTIPSIAKQSGAKIIEINKESTHLTGTITDIFLEGSAGEIMPALVSEVKELRSPRF